MPAPPVQYQPWSKSPDPTLIGFVIFKEYIKNKKQDRVFVFHGCKIQMQVARKMSQTVMPLQTAPKADLSHVAGLKASSIQKSYSLGIVIKYFSHL